MQLLFLPNCFIKYCIHYFKGKSIKKSAKILAILILIIASLIILAWAGLRTPAVQTIVAKKIINQLSAKSGISISIKKVRYRLNNSLLIKDLLIKDERHDTLIYINKIEANIKNIDLNLNNIYFKNIKINKAYTNTYNITNDSLNFSFLLKKLKKDSSKPFNWKIKCDELNIFKSSVKHKTLYKNPFLLNHISISINDISIDSTKILFSTKSVILHKNNSALIKDLAFNIEIIKDDFKLSNLNLFTRNSHFDIQQAHFFKDSDGDNIGKLNIISSRINLNDFSFINPKFKNINEEFSISGNLDIDKQTISGKNIKLFVGNKSSVHANMRVINYKNKDEIAYFVNFENAFTNRTDIANIAMGFFQKDSSEIPTDLKVMGDIAYQGILKGNADSITSQGKISTSVGIIESNLSIRKNINEFIIDGNIKTDPIYLNEIVKNEMFGDLALNMNTSGTYSKKHGIDLKLSGYIKNIDINEYNIDSILIDGNVSNDQFRGKISSYDPNLRADFEGIVSFAPSPSYNFVSHIYSANLYALGFSNTDSTANLSVNLNAKFSGQSFDSSDGTILISDLFYFQDTTYLATDSILIRSVLTNKGKKLTFRSEFIDASFIGNYNLVSLIKDLKVFTHSMLPSFTNASKLTASGLNNFNFSVNAKYPHPIIEILMPGLSISPGTKIDGVFNSNKQQLQFTCLSNQIDYNNQKISDFSLKTYTKNNKLFINLDSKEYQYSKSNSLKNVLLSLSIHNDSIQSNLNWNNWLDKNYSGNINSLAIILPGFKKNEPNIKVNFYPSNIIVVDTLWTLNECSVKKDSSGITLQNIHIEKGESVLEVDGKISDNPTDSIILNIKKVDLNNLNILLKKDRLNFGGFLSGKCVLKDLKGEHKIDSDLEIQNLLLNKQLIGQTKIKTHWNKEMVQLDLEGSTYKNQKQTFKFSGFIAPGRKEMLIDLNLIDQDMEILEAFLRPTFDNITGTLSGNIRIYGNPKSPLWKGTTFAKKTTLEIVPTNVKYHFSDSLRFINNKILFNNVALYDRDSNYAIINGHIYNTDLKQFGVNFKITTDKILGFDTKHNHNPYYYGTVYGAGIVDIAGPTKEITIGIAATTLNNSKFFIPLAGKGDIKDNEFIAFVDHSKQEKNIRNTKAITEKKTKTTINIDVNITPATEVQIIFDPKIGDVLKANGNAQINMVSKPDEFAMYGDYVIEKGEFLFTLHDVINKRLDIVQGSSVSWNGHPGIADVDLDAIYRVRRASIYDLTQAESDKEKRIPVDCHLLMTNTLTNPDINFSVEVTSNTNNEVIEQLNSLPEDELNKQIISLLLLNKFAPLTITSSDNETSTSASLGATTVSELLSNQLSHWLSQLNSDFDLGFTLRPGTETIETEYELALSTTLWNDRVTVYGNLGYGGQNTQADKTNSQYTTDFTVELKVNKKGNIRVRAFQKENDDIDELNPAPYKQGIGIFYTEEFDKFSELMQRIFRKEYATKPKEVEVESESDS